MPRYAANLTMLWPELGDPYARFAAAAAAGFTRVERLFLHDLDPERVGALLADLGPAAWSSSIPTRATGRPESGACWRFPGARPSCASPCWPPSTPPAAWGRVT